jgi:oligopeptidase B
MKKAKFFTFISCFLSLQIMAQKDHNNAPIAPIHPKVLTKHNHQRIDPYFWMNERDSKPVLGYIEEENKYSAAYFNRISNITETLLTEFDNRIDPNETSAPFDLNGRTYCWKSSEGNDYRTLYVYLNGNETVFIDENERAKHSKFYQLGEFALSTDNSMVAISEDLVGRRNYTIKIRNNATNTFLKEEINNTDGSVIWANDNKTLFYVRKDPQTLREFQVFRHTLGTKPSSDQLVYEEKDERFSVYITKTLDNAYIQIYSESSTTSELSMISADQPLSKASVFLPRQQNHLYSVSHHTDGFYIVTNKDSPNRKMVFSTTIPSGIEACPVIIPHSTNRYIENVLILKDQIVAQFRESGKTTFNYSNIHVIDFHTVQFEEPVYEIGFSWNEDFNAHSFNYFYNSFTTPPSIAKFDFTSQTSNTYFQKKLRDLSFSPANYESQRIWATANDGTKIPISIVYKKGVDLSKAPLLLYGYGSYGYTIPCNFSATRLSLLDRGFVFAIAHVRGGKFMGEAWYQDGKMNQKRNTFTDFINAAEWLGMKGYCNPNSIYAQGGSAGGLLMGAVINMAPYLFKGVVAQVPFVDVVTTMLDETIPLTVGEYEEWGNPNEVDSYWYQLSYSPYDNVRKMNYPALFITTGYHDSQVQYWEPLKWIAKLRTMNTGNQPLLLDCTMDAGHGGGSGRTSERLEVAKEYAFILDLQGIHR